MSGHRYRWLAGAYDLEKGQKFFKSGSHGGYLVHSGFFVQCKFVSNSMFVKLMKVLMIL